MGSTIRTLIEDVVAVGDGVAFDNDVTPNLQKHACIIELDASLLVGGNFLLKDSDDGVTYAQAVDTAGNNILLAAASEPREYSYVMKNHMLVNVSAYTSGNAQAHVIAT